jgi:RNA polymerase sporulation-specific sigma factor
MHLRSQKKTLSDISLQEPVGVDKEGNEVSLIELIGNDNDSVFEEIELKMQIKKLYNKMRMVLKNREKTVIELRYGLGGGNERTQKEIGKMLGISRSYVSRIEKKALKKLYKAMKPAE